MDYMEKERGEWEQSQGIYHEYRHEKKDKNPVTGLRQKQKNQRGENRMHEIFRMGNTYGNVALGTNEKGEFSFVVNREKIDGVKTVEGSKKELSEQFGTVYGYRDGRQIVNQDKKQTGAFAYETYAPERQTKRMMRSVTDFKDKYGQETLEGMVPFVGEETTREELLEREQKERLLLEGKASASARRKAAADTEKKRHELARKQQLGKEMMYKLNRAIGEAWSASVKKREDFLPSASVTTAKKKGKGKPKPNEDENF